MHVCIQSANLGRSLHFIDKSVKKQSIVCWTARTNSGKLEVGLTLNSQSTVHQSVWIKFGELTVCPIKNRLYHGRPRCQWPAVIVHITPASSESFSLGTCSVSSPVSQQPVAHCYILFCVFTLFLSSQWHTVAFLYIINYIVSLNERHLVVHAKLSKACRWALAEHGLHSQHVMRAILWLCV